MLVSSFDAGIYPRCKWGITDIDGTAYGDWNPGCAEYYAATEEERYQLYNTMPEYVKDWLKSLRPHPKQEWSEEDEKTLNTVILKGDLKPSEIDWLKSLKERYTWKPSNEQMEVLNWCKPLWSEPKTKAVLESLIEDLKKLKGE